MCLCSVCRMVVMDIRRVCRIPSKGNHTWLCADMQVGSTRVLEEQLVLSTTGRPLSLYPLLYLLTMVMGMWISVTQWFQINIPFSCPTFYFILRQAHVCSPGGLCLPRIVNLSLSWHLSPWAKPLLTFSLFFTTCACMEFSVGKWV